MDIRSKGNRRPGCMLRARFIPSDEWRPRLSAFRGSAVRPSAARIREQAPLAHV